MNDVKPSTTQHDPEHDIIIIFDDVCVLCSAAVQWIMRRDARSYCRFASLSGELRARLLRHTGQATLPDSILVIADAKLLVESSAAIRIAQELRSPWNLLRAVRFLPRFLRDFVYRRIAASRYSLFGKRDQCYMPRPEDAWRWVSENEIEVAITSMTTSIED